MAHTGEEVRSFCSSLEHNLTLVMRVSLDTCQNNVCSVRKCRAVHRMYLCLHWMAKGSSLLTYISRFVPVTVQERFCSSVQQCDLSLCRYLLCIFYCCPHQQSLNIWVCYSSAQCCIASSEQIYIWSYDSSDDDDRCFHVGLDKARAQLINIPCLEKAIC